MTKPTKWPMHPAKTQIGLGIHPIWSESSLSAWRNIGSLATHWVHSDDSDQTGCMPRLIWVFAGSTCHFVGFDMQRLICLLLKLHGVYPVMENNRAWTLQSSFKVSAPWMRIYDAVINASNIAPLSFNLFQINLKIPKHKVIPAFLWLALHELWNWPI